MSAVDLTWVDAFTDRPYGGNPAAVCVCQQAPTDEAMQALAAELGLSETAYLVQGSDSWSLRWFTPTTEVDLCGHATLAAAHALRASGRASPGETLRFTTRSGQLLARLCGDGLIELDFPAAPPTPVALPEPLAAMSGAVVSAHRGGFLLLELADEGAVRAFQPDHEAFRRLPDHAVIVTALRHADTPGYVLRMFGPKVGIDEDPVTGSAQCTAGPFWAQRLGRAGEPMDVVQCSARGGRLRVTVDGDRVRIAGRAVTVLRGTVELG